MSFVAPFYFDIFVVQERAHVTEIRLLGCACVMFGVGRTPLRTHSRRIFSVKFRLNDSVVATWHGCFCWTLIPSSFTSYYYSICSCIHCVDVHCLWSVRIFIVILWLFVRTLLLNLFVFRPLIGLCKFGKFCMIQLVSMEMKARCIHMRSFVLSCHVENVFLKPSVLVTVFVSVFVAINVMWKPIQLGWNLL